MNKSLFLHEQAEVECKDTSKVTQLITDRADLKARSLDPKSSAPPTPPSTAKGKGGP